MLTLSLTLLAVPQPARADRIKFCFLFCEVETTAPIDSFCQSYQPVMRSPADAAVVKGARGQVQNRVVKNDVFYRCACTGWTDPICKKISGVSQ